MELTKTTTKELWKIFRRLVREERIIAGYETDICESGFRIYQRHNMRREFDLKLNNVIVELCRRLDCTETRLNHYVWRTLETMSHCRDEGLPPIYSQHDLASWKRFNLPKTEPLRKKYLESTQNERTHNSALYRLYIYCNRHRIDYKIAPPPVERFKTTVDEIPF